MTGLLRRRAASTLLLLASLTGSAQAAPLDEALRATVERFVEAMRTNDRTMIARRVRYPLRRKAPIPAIEDEAAMLERFDEVFDAELIERITHADIERDWSVVGWRGIMLDRGILWLDRRGWLIAVNHQSRIEARLAREGMETERAALHPSLRAFEAPVLDWKTATHRLRVDAIGDGVFRYATWPVDTDPLERPEIVVSDGRLVYDGSGGNRYYAFTQDETTYAVFITVVGTSANPTGRLEVSKNGKLLESAPVVEELGTPVLR